MVHDSAGLIAHSADRPCHDEKASTPIQMIEERHKEELEYLLRVKLGLH